MDDPSPIFIVALVCIGLPWLIFHYITKWKQSASLSEPDEQLLDDLYDAARRLDERLCSIERIMSAENPDWRKNCLPTQDRGTPRALLEDLDQLESRMDSLSSRRRQEER